jgi:hypothetical protein
MVSKEISQGNMQGNIIYKVSVDMRGIHMPQFEIHDKQSAGAEIDLWSPTN